MLDRQPQSVSKNNLPSGPRYSDVIPTKVEQLLGRVHTMWTRPLYNFIKRPNNQRDELTSHENNHAMIIRIQEH